MHLNFNFNVIHNVILITQNRMLTMLSDKHYHTLYCQSVWIKKVT